MKRILVVDDEMVGRKVAITVLETAGYEVFGADGGKTGIEAARRLLPDLVLMDVQMPDMDGIRALRYLRADPCTAAVKVAAFTALAMKGDLERLLDEGFDGYLVKPIRYKEFLADVTALLDAT